jgi:hypothetical protein
MAIRTHQLQDCQAGTCASNSKTHYSTPAAFSRHAQHPRAAAPSMRSCSCISSLCIAATHSLCGLKHFSWGHLFNSTKHEWNLATAATAWCNCRNH